ncbi:MAG TPA: SUF system Fe-S cluster assembly protein [Alphaproteobacteria bacterium]|nr:SUF system Fe-S cluster assembly protein [Alphaproteobacteria bacterium]
MSKMEQVADKEMVKNAVGDEYDELAVPPNIEVADHKLAPLVVSAIKEIYDPEIPVNIYELGLIYKIDINDKGDVYVEMTLTSPGCPVAQEMPGWVQSAVMPIDGVGHVDVDIVWDPPWDPSMMAETAKLQLNMFT